LLSPLISIPQASLDVLPFNPMHGLGAV